MSANRWAVAKVNPYRSLAHLVLYARVARKEGRRARAADILGEIARKRRDTQATGDFQERRMTRRPVTFHPQYIKKEGKP